MITLYLIHHAECEANNEETLVGRALHIPLTRLGEYQARALGKHLRKEGVVFDHVFTSPEERAKRTACLTCEEVGYPASRILLTEGLHETTHGAWEGKPRSLFTDVHRLRQWHFRPPQGESLQDTEERVHQFLEQNIISRYHEGHVALFTHPFAMRSLLRRLLDADPVSVQHMNFDHASVTKLYFNSFGWKVGGVNATPHLAWLKE